MTENNVLQIIKDNLFYGSTDYTKSQPDLFTPHKFRMIAPSKTGEFLETAKESLSGEDELLLYCHMPFCFSECLFCNSFPYRTDKNAQNAYVISLLKEIEMMADRGFFAGRKIRCVYFGGGTPTTFPTADLGRVLDKISAVTSLRDDCNITTEAHPYTLPHKESVKALADIGINRISCGCQTFDQDILRFCNRQNTKDQIERIVRDAQDCGMTINIDMMSGLPGQSLKSVQKDLEILEHIRPDAIEYIRHEIVNPLILKLYKENPALMVGNDELFEMVRMTQEWMGAKGYEQNGTFTSPASWPYRYHWLNEMPIIAFGLHARSYTKNMCYDKHDELSTYTGMINKNLVPVGRYIALSLREQMYRSLFLGIQLNKGLEIDKFSRRYGADPLVIFSSVFSELKGYGCLKLENEAISLTKYGAIFVEDVCDYIIDALLKEESDSLVRTPHSVSGPTPKFN
jgi:oxygen-independent coproporphyrinogen III oxidase